MPLESPVVHNKTEFKLTTYRFKFSILFINAKLSKLIGWEASVIISAINFSSTSIPIVLNVARKSFSHMNPSLFWSNSKKHYCGKFIIHFCTKNPNLPLLARAVWSHQFLECQQYHPHLQLVEVYKVLHFPSTTHALYSFLLPLFDATLNH